MKQSVRWVVATMATALVGVGAVATPALAGDRVQTRSIKGSHVFAVKGLMGDKPAFAEYRLDVTRTNGRVAAGTQRWRACPDTGCGPVSFDGDGWSEPESVLLVKRPSGEYIGRSNSGQLALTLPKSGRISVSYLGNVTMPGLTARSSSSSGFDGDCFNGNCYGYKEGT